ncbi:hypothetical protein E0H22_15170 [Rhodopseudomonas boonkerdii]|uniref:hypothetical protein n=1 Tax=Rhodopseudomonas boonkerdii TaxID=475937 RepID=UPI001E2913A2|nr:hypothetical protein [Rhodopseudomonas boonkerdii]UGV26907.1 hypothetical protein E0H22_15170 [Rhodopseudomonas boonkerdii]
MSFLKPDALTARQFGRRIFQNVGNDRRHCALDRRRFAQFLHDPFDESGHSKASQTQKRIERAFVPAERNWTVRLTPLFWLRATSAQVSAEHRHMHSVVGRAMQTQL